MSNSNWSTTGNDGDYSTSTNTNSTNQEYTYSNYTTQKNQQYSPMDSYLKHPESHERTALAHGTSDPKKAVKSHRKKIAKEISEVEGKSRK